jgi:hypothetical protein
MKCEKCGEESFGSAIDCPQCGNTGNVMPTLRWAPGEVGQARATGSDEVRDSKEPDSLSGSPPIAPSVGQLGRVIENAGG